MKNLPYVRKNITFSKRLRQNMTPEERHLWYDFLRSYPVKFRRQQPVDRYIVDFYCRTAKLVIELDGGQHYEDENQKADLERTEILEKYGLTVLRFTNLEIKKNFQAVCEVIDQVVKERTPSDG